MIFVMFFAILFLASCASGSRMGGGKGCGCGAKKGMVGY